jgi:hypothetical protein
MLLLGEPHKDGFSPVADVPSEPQVRDLARTGVLAYPTLRHREHGGNFRGVKKASRGSDLGRGDQVLMGLRCRGCGCGATPQPLRTHNACRTRIRPQRIPGIFHFGAAQGARPLAGRRHRPRLSRVKPRSRSSLGSRQRRPNSGRQSSSAGTRSCARRLRYSVGPVCGYLPTRRASKAESEAKSRPQVEHSLRGGRRCA